MNEEINVGTEVLLQIDNVVIKCVKQDLTYHSDYFKAMFEGSFVESNKKVVKLEGIDLKAMNIILALLWDRTFLINEEDILSVLQVSCMLQFTEIKEMCLAKLNELLFPRNCLKIWLVAEQLDLKPLYLKAKSMSLIEFDAIKDLESITDLSLKQLCCYLSNACLQCKTEMDVFQLCMKWWYGNFENNTELNMKDVFLNFLFCLDFKALLNNDIQEIITYPDISSCKDIVRVLECSVNLNKNLGEIYSEEVLAIVRRLKKSKPRLCKQFPCILINTGTEEQARKKQRTSSSDVLYDMFLRKRYYKNIESTDSSMSIIYYGKQQVPICPCITYRIAIHGSFTDMKDQVIDHANIDRFYSAQQQLSTKKIGLFL
ncbi:hypothetical protein FQA39_LY19238 [Lamprigera yunnana]|nr:hypothetical protein FQA39_LY19238 [Lamprigera yunnana]